MADIEHLSQSPQTEEEIETSAQQPIPIRSRGRADVFLLLSAVLILAAFLRFMNVNWDEGEHLHPDERYMTMVTGAIRSPGAADSFQNPPSDCITWGGYFDSYCSPLNPYNHQGYGSYAYGTLPLFTARYVGEWLNGACIEPGNPDAAPSTPKQWIAELLFDDAEGCAGNRFTDYGHVQLLGRMLSALVDLGTIGFLFLIGRRLYGPKIGLLAAALYALAALPIQQSHFYTVDAFATFFITAAIYFVVRSSQNGRWRDFILAGLSFGFALASKVSVWPFAAIIVLGGILYYVRSRKPDIDGPVSGQASTDPTNPRNNTKTVLDWLMVLLLIILIFLVVAISLFGIWSAVRIAFFFAVGLLFVGGVAFYALRPAAAPPVSGTAGKKPMSVDSVLLRVLAAGLCAFLAFRVAQPYAFVGTHFDTSRWDDPEYDWLRGNVPDIWYTLNDKLPGPVRAMLLPDPRFIGTLGSVNKQLTGEQDVPWGHQWTNRVPFLFPWTNMVFWGLGLALGIAAWIGWGVAGWELWRGRRRMRHLIPWAWVAILFFYQGTQWVKSIRYLLPIYPVLILLGAWFLVLLWRKASEVSSAAEHRWLHSAAYRLPLVSVVVATSLWAWGFSRIYSRPVTRNTASRWMVENIPSAITLRYQTHGETRSQFLRTQPYTYSDPGLSHITPFVLPEGSELTGVKFTHLGDPDLDAAPETFRVVVASDVMGEQILASAERSIHLEEAKHRLGDPQDFELGPTTLEGEREYYLITTAVDGAPIHLDTTVIANEYPDDSLPTRVDGQDPFGALYRGLQSSGDGKTHWDLGEDANKLSMALEWLDEADIIALSSNRGYASIPRLPGRYPMAVAFYEALFAEELGFELIASFTAYPTIGPFQFPDQETPFPLGNPSLIRDEMGTISVNLPPAEEAFSVYDHPQVFLFRKTEAYSRELAEEILGRPNLSQVVWMKPTEATLAPTALLHTQEELDVQRQGGTWRRIFDAQDWLNRSPFLSVLVWWMLVQAIGLFAFPLLFVTVPGLRDRGWPLAKTLGLVLLALLVWLPASTSVGWSSSNALLQFSKPLIFLMVLLLASVGGALAWRQRQRLAAWVSVEKKAIFVSELLFSGMFLAFLLVRIGNPDLWHPVMGGERPMDFAYLNAVLKSTNFPPYDPWFSGGYLNYYYFGFVLVGTLIKLLGLLPEIAYNLILPTFFALTGAGAYSVAFNVISSWQERAALTQKDASPFHSTHPIKRAVLAGLIAALFVAVLGNLAEISLVADGFYELGSDNFEFHSTIPGLEQLVVSARGVVRHVVGGEPMPWRPEWPYWNASRAIPHPDTEAPPITEFPFFTFLYSDLHAHLLVLPLTVLALTFMVNWVVDPGFWGVAHSGPPSRLRRLLPVIVGLILSGAVIGALRPTNTWDYVTYLVLTPLVLTIGYVVHRVGVERARLDLQTVRSGVVAIGGRTTLLATVSYVVFLPYITRYATASTGFELWKGSKTPLWAYLGVHGLFLLPILSWLLMRTVSRFVPRISRQNNPESVEAAGRTPPRIPFAKVVLFGSIALATLFAAVAGYPISLIVLPFGVLALGLLVARDTLPSERFIALLVGVGLGLTLLVEFLVLNQGDVGRMNTVFKFYLQVWVLFGIAAAAAIIWVSHMFGQATRTSASNEHGVTQQPVSQDGEPLAGIDATDQDSSRGSLITAAYKGWQIFLLLLVAIASLYPILATRAKINDRWDREVGPGLNSLTWMQTVTDTQFGPGAPEGLTFPILWDYEALMWLRDNVQGSPVVIEGAKAPPYRSLRGRVATYTGLPIVIGYPWHQKQQRSFIQTDVVGQRERDVDSVFTTSDPWLAKEILDRYDVGLVYVGDLERAHYPAAGIDKFAKMTDTGLLNQIYTNPGVTIYEVVR